MGSHDPRYMVIAESPPAKRVKLSETIRTERIREVREDIEEIDRHLTIKEKCLQQAETSSNYSVSINFSIR